MKSIRVLSPQEIQLIAAGEVVESPASIIKELVENAFDADASQIVISIKNSGLEYIEVRDNGYGIAQEELRLALCPHATSKVKAVSGQRIENDALYGFRGEALAAISAVSSLSLHSKPIPQAYGYAVKSIYGIIEDEPQPVPLNPGTTVIVKNLFENVPVRKKHLFAKITIEKNILYIVQGLALGKPNKAITFLKDNKTVYALSKKNTFIERATDFLSRDISSYVSIAYQDEYCIIEGLISAVEYGQYDRNKIFIVVNERLLKQPKLTQICIKAYEADQFERRFPELYLHISVPEDQIDINVHPRKEEVLFLYQKKIESILYKVIIAGLEKRAKELLHLATGSFSKPTISFSSREKDMTQKEYPTGGTAFYGSDDETATPQTKQHADQLGLFLTAQDQSMSIIPAEVCKQDNFSENRNEMLYGEEVRNKPVSLEYRPNPVKEELVNNCSVAHSRLSYIGTLDRTYLLFLSQKSLLFFDQHALHEKICYRQFLEKKKERSVFHALLFAESFFITHEEIEILEMHKDFIHRYFFRFTTSLSDQQLIIHEIVCSIKELDRLQLVQKIIFLLGSDNSTPDDQKCNLIWHEIAATASCKNAIKAGDSLKPEEIELLIEQAHTTDEVFLCPHGRPVFYEMHTTELEKLFRRK